MSGNFRPWPATREIARMITNTNSNSIGDEARAMARNAVIDTIGVSLAGLEEAGTRFALRLAREEGGNSQATIWGEGDRNSASSAAFVNGVAGHALDFDDVDFVMKGHPSVTLVPALVALAEERGIGGREVLDAYVVGFELLHLLGHALIPQHYRRGFHATATLGTIGVAGACAHLVGLDAGRTRHALSLAASEAAGLVCNFGTMTKPFHAGQAARAGQVAARLAEMGFTAAPDTLETGFTAATAAEGIGPGVESFADWERAAEGWGAPWDMVRGVSVKIHPCCAMTHPAIDAMLDLCEREGVHPEEVEALGSQSSPMAHQVLRYREADTGLEGKFSMPFCLASAVLDGKVGLSQFREESVSRPVLRDLQRRTAFDLDPEYAANDPESEGAEIWVRLKGGRELRSRENIARGHVDRPIGLGELRDKFIECATEVLSRSRAEKAWEGWWNLDGVLDVGELTSLVVASHR